MKNITHGIDLISIERVNSNEMMWIIILIIFEFRN